MMINDRGAVCGMTFGSADQVQSKPAPTPLSTTMPRGLSEGIAYSLSGQGARQDQSVEQIFL
jgi:hypothetical protein